MKHSEIMLKIGQINILLEVRNQASNMYPKEDYKKIVYDLVNQLREELRSDKTYNKRIGELSRKIQSNLTSHEENKPEAI